MKSNGAKTDKGDARPEPPERPQQEVDDWALSSYGRKRVVKGKKY